MILSAWLTEAAGEEQTSVLHIILKVHIDPSILDRWPIISFFMPEYCCSNGCFGYQVLCHLPLHKAIPVHMSAILQSVNSLRFYRTPGVLSLHTTTPYFIFRHLCAKKTLKKFKLFISMAYTFLVACLKVECY